MDPRMEWVGHSPCGFLLPVHGEGESSETVVIGLHKLFNDWDGVGPNGQMQTIKCSFHDAVRTADAHHDDGHL